MTDDFCHPLISLSHKTEATAVPRETASKSSAGMSKIILKVLINVYLVIFLLPRSVRRIGECVEHIALSETNLFGMIQGTLKEKAAPEGRSEIKPS